MSYARFGWDGSDVYIYLSFSGTLDCCACCLGQDGWTTASFASTDAMLAHLQEHLDAGHTIPGYVIQDLRKDQASNDAFIKDKAT